MREPNNPEGAAHAALKARFERLAHRVAAATPSKEDGLRPRLRAPHWSYAAEARLIQAIRTGIKALSRFRARYTWGSLLTGALATAFVLVLTAPFLWALMLHGVHLAEHSLSMSPADYMAKMETIDGENDEGFFANVRNLGLLALALIALPLAVWRGWTAHKQAKTAEKGLIIDRYQKGAQMLESSDLSVRIAGIYALRELALNDPEETYFLVLEVLYAFAREKSKGRKHQTNLIGTGSGNIEYGNCPADIQNALAAATRIRNKSGASLEQQRTDWSPNLSRSNLSNADLQNANLAGARFQKADLSGALLSGTVLAEAVIDETTIISGIWAYKDTPPRNMPKQIEKTIAYRNTKEAWENFVVRIMKERPELGWSKGARLNAPD